MPVQMHLRSVLGAVLGFTAYMPCALAEDAAPQPGAANPQLEEVLVTAERRESKLQDTPIAVSVIDGGEIQRERLINLSDIAAKVPSITFNQVNHSESFISIRGTTIGNDAAGIDQGFASGAACVEKEIAPLHDHQCSRIHAVEVMVEGRMDTTDRPVKIGT